MMSLTTGRPAMYPFQAILRNHLSGIFGITAQNAIQPEPDEVQKEYT
jgi:hypothetical protein